MPGPTGSQPSKLKNPVPEMSADVPEGQKVEFKTPLDVTAEVRAPASDSAPPSSEDPELDALINDFPQDTSPQMPVPSQGSTTSPVSEEEDLDELISEFDKSDEPIVAIQGIDPILPNGKRNPFYGKEVEGQIFNWKMKVNAQGDTLMYDPWTKKYRPIHENEKVIFKTLYDQSQQLMGDVLSGVGSIGAGMLPIGKVLGLGAKGLKAAKAALQIAGSGAGSFTGDAITRKNFRPNYESKEDFLLRRGAGIDDSEAFAGLTDPEIYTRAGVSMGFEAGAQAIGGLAGKYAARKKAESEAIESLIPSVKQAEINQKRFKALTGQDLTPAEAAMGLPGVNFAGATGVKEARALAMPNQVALMKGTSSPADALAFEAYNDARVQYVMNAFDKASKEMVGPYHGIDPVDLPIAQVGKAKGGKILGAAEGFPEPLNAFDRARDKYLAEVSTYRNEIRNLENAGLFTPGSKRTFIDPVPILAEAEAALRPRYSGKQINLGQGKIGTYFNQDGTLNWDHVFSHREGTVDLGYRELLNKIKSIREKVERLPGGLDRLKQMSRKSIFPKGEDVSGGIPFIEKNQYQMIGGPDNLPNMKGNLSLDRQSPLNATQNTSLFSEMGMEQAGSVKSDIQMGLQGSSYRPSNPKLTFVDNDSAPGVRYGSLKFDDIVGLTDSLQKVAYSERLDGEFSGTLKRMAAVSRDLEAQAAKEIAERNGRPVLAQSYELANKNASKAISAVDEVGNIVKANPTAIGPLLYQVPRRMEVALSTLTESEVKQLRQSVIESAKFGNINRNASGDVISIDPSALKKELFGSPEKVKSAQLLFGKENASKLSMMIDGMERIPGAASPTGGQLGAYQKVINGIKNFRGSPDYLMTIVRDHLNDRPEIADIIEAQVSNILAKLESEHSKKKARAAAMGAIGKKVSKYGGAAVNAATAIPNIYDLSTIRGEKEENKK